MNEQEQVAMDGSPRRIMVSLGDLNAAGKFKGAPLDFRRSPDADRETVIDLIFQCGPIQEVGVNGCAIEDVIDVLIARLFGFQQGPFACHENAAAVKSLMTAKDHLLDRTAKRQAQGVEGTNAPHTEEPR